MPTNETIKWFAELDQSMIAIAGGKGANLGTLARSDIPVPAGFVITTPAYNAFVQSNQFQNQIIDIAAQTEANEPSTFETASQKIQVLFRQGVIADDLAAEITSAYQQLTQKNGPAVAVRSSATAEDLPDASFAGQQDTYLNVQGDRALLEAVKKCWASLWTGRAISYRMRQEIDPASVSLAVVVQQLIPADSAGILFTANPINGQREQILINAAWGLGEAIVGGLVTPDTVVVNKEDWQILSRSIASKTMMTVRTDTGTEEEPVPQARQDQPVLDDATAIELARYGGQIERHYGMPMDIEWAISGGEIAILQARPITNLPPAPWRDVRWEPPQPGGKLIRRQVVENMPDPLSPLFDELYLGEGLDKSMDAFMHDLGLEFNYSMFVERPFFLTVHGYAYCRANYKFSWRIIPMIMKAYAKMLPSLLRNGIPRWRDEKLPAYLAVIDKWRDIDLSTARDEQLWSGIHALTLADAIYWFEVSIIIGLAKITDNLLHSFLTKLHPVEELGEEGRLTSALFLRGFPSKTLEAQVDLESIAQQIRASAELHQLVLKTPTATLLETLEKQPAAEAVVAGIQAYLQNYGHQIYTLDFAEPTQGEDPLPILLGLKALVEHPTDSTKRQAEMAQEREALAERTAQSLGRLKRWGFRKLLGWAQKYGPHREEALFYIGAAWPALRRLAHELGGRLVEGGTLQAPDDLFYLTRAEVKSAITARANGEPSPDYKQLAQERRELREARKRLHPPGKIPDVPFKFGPFDMSIFETQTLNEDESSNLKGFAVSPGKITGRASVILSPADFEKMQPNTILVCPTTTPAWTPLFSQATGLVTDIGGILAHGSIVAREYGIPAVLGLGNATLRIADGQMITVDGNRGVVTIIDQ